MVNDTRVSFDEFVSASSFWAPDFASRDSAWLEHAPFAFWLTQMLEPQSFVELGTHAGFSYFCFCQAILKLDLPTGAYAVDTWRGDEHSGSYGENVYIEVERYNRERFAGFSNLIRSTFDEASFRFDDGSIDLLHIDGRHFYEDVKADFEIWKPKLSNRAVVLFHDTSVRERDFGVYRLWEEIKDGYPFFEFSHGHGLGVLGLGKDLPPSLNRWFDRSKNMQTTEAIRSAYSRLGQTVKFNVAAEHYRGVVKTGEKELVNLQNLLSEQKRKSDIYLEQKDALLLEMEEKSSQIAKITQSLTDAHQFNVELQTQHASLSTELKSVEMFLENRTKEKHEVEMHLHNILQSRSWRMMTKLHKIYSKLK